MSEFGFYIDNEGDTSQSFIIDSRPDESNPYRVEESQKGSKNQSEGESSNSKENPTAEREGHSPPLGLLLPEHVRIAQENKRLKEREEDENGGKENDKGKGKGKEKGKDQDQDQDEDHPDEDEEQSRIDDGNGHYIELDAISKGDVPRYYQTEEEKEIRNAKVCETCQERGHDKRDCEHLLCVACGAFDDHESRNCPMKVSCFRCNGSGHIASNCPKPAAPGERLGRHCNRCGSRGHVEMSCPSLWRIYAYNTDDEYARERAIAAAQMERQRRAEGGDFSPVSSPRRRRRGGSSRGSDMDLSSGEFSSEELLTPRSDWDPAELWCYNCAARGEHWGDDCPLPRATSRRGTLDPSAYSDYVSTSGPFGRKIPLRPRSHRSDDRGGFQFGNHHQHFDFSVGPSASMHLAGNGAGFGREPDNVEEAIDSLFDPKNRPSKRFSSRSEKEDSRRKSQSERERKRAKRRRSPSPQNAFESNGKSKAQEKDWWLDLDADDMEDGFAKFESTSGNKKKKPKKEPKESKAKRAWPQGYEDQLNQNGVAVETRLSRKDRGRLKKAREGDSAEHSRDESIIDGHGDSFQKHRSHSQSHSRSSSSNSNKARSNGQSKADRYEQMKLEREERLRLENRGGPSDPRKGAPRQRYGEPSFGRFSTDGYRDEEDRGGSGRGYDQQEPSTRNRVGSGSGSGSGSGKGKGKGQGKGKRKGSSGSSSSPSGNRKKNPSHHSNNGNKPRYQGSY